MTSTLADVLIVGAGPVGTALAIDLTRRGLAVRIIDKAEHGFDGSRAKGVQPRTLEVLEDLGALDDVITGGGTYPLMGVHLGPTTVPWRMLRSPHVAYGPSAAEALASLPWPTNSAALTRATVNARAESANVDHHLQDSTGDFAKSYGIDGPALILVRPDGYLASIASRDLLAATEAAIRPFIAAPSGGAV